jgi:hypothetical protein
MGALKLDRRASCSVDCDDWTDGTGELSNLVFIAPSSTQMQIDRKVSERHCFVSGLEARGLPSPPSLASIRSPANYSLSLLLGCASCSFLMWSGDSSGRSTLIVSLLCFAVSGNGGR